MAIDAKIEHPNIKMLELAATRLGDVCSEVVFLGGCTTALFITDLAVPDVRYTLDVDCIVDVISLSDYYHLEKRLRQQGFKRKAQDEVICRWHYDDLTLDVMPTDERILGFGNRWNKMAIRSAINYSVTKTCNIKTVSAPYFLATKLEAFKTRGQMDFLTSHDFEDIISVLDGRLELAQEIEQVDIALRNYLANKFDQIIKMRGFHDALPGHLVQYGNLADDRIVLLHDRIKIISQLGESSLV